jgi:tRNA (guanine37-N1)-methyltransferase
MRIDVLSIFPDYLQPLRLSLVGKAIEAGIVELGVHDLRDWTHDRHRTVDDTPYGGGAGMVMRPEPWGEALDELSAASPTARLIMLTPSGRTFDQRVARELAAEDHLIVGCGRYEGVDARVVEHAATRMRVDELSIGDYVLSGGEAAALVIIEAIVRLLPGVVGNPESLTEESHSADHDGLLEYPLYTKPPSWRGLEVPEILSSGHHGRIAAWRRSAALTRTRELRPDLLPADDPASLVIEPATIDDAGELWTLQQAAYVSEGRLNGSFEIPPLMETLTELRASLAAGTVLVAKRGGRLVGSVRGDQAEGGVWYIGRLMVAPDLHGQGIGSRLLSEIEACAPAGTTRLRLRTGVFSAGNLAYYRRRGYVEVGRTIDQGGTTAVIMDRPLRATGR